MKPLISILISALLPSLTISEEPVDPRSTLDVYAPRDAKSLPKNTDHLKINANLGTAGDPATAELDAFLAAVLKK
jgi:hypothetical protein